MDYFLKILESIILSAIPIIEQKAAIPFAVSHKIFFSASELSLSYLEAYIYTLLGALIPAPLILKFIPYVFEFLKKHHKFKKIVEWYEERAMRKGKNIVKYEYLGLLLFVAIPLPGTGVWTGSAVASLLKLDFKKSVATVFLGAAICGIIVLLVTKGVFSLPFL
jgi:uncharacterized membrane protein